MHCVNRVRRLIINCTGLGFFCYLLVEQCLKSSWSNSSVALVLDLSKVGLRICVALTISQSSRDLEARDTLWNRQAGRPMFEPPTPCSASPELYHSTIAASSIGRFAFGNLSKHYEVPFTRMSGHIASSPKPSSSETHTRLRYTPLHLSSVGLRRCKTICDKIPTVLCMGQPPHLTNFYYLSALCGRWSLYIRRSIYTHFKCVSF